MKIPFDSDGNQMHKVYNYAGSQDIDWRDIDVLKERLTFEDMHKYSSYVVTFTNDSGKQFWMSNGEFIKAVKFMVNGVLEGKFRFKRSGAYYSLSYDNGKP